MDWIDEEINKIKQDKKFYEKNPRLRSNTQFYKILAVLMFLLAFVFSGGLEAREEHKQLKLEWVCSCGWDNYDEIAYCGVCGKKRPWSGVLFQGGK